jgi:hypothetical protein
VDPCDPPVSLDSEDLDNQEYTVTAPFGSYTVPNFVVKKVFCPVTYSYEISKFTDDSGDTNASGIVRNDMTFKWFWNKDKSPVG